MNKIPEPDCVLFDTHCHLDMLDAEPGLEGLLQAAGNAGVATILTVAIDLASSESALALACQHTGIFACLGVHPHNVAAAGSADYERIAALARGRRDRVVAYGEIGLDYAKRYAPIEMQQHHFRLQLQLAQELGLPVVVHDRDAHGDTLGILQEFSPFAAGGVMHCFSGDRDFARRVLDLGFLLSLPGIVTFPGAAALRDVAVWAPVEALVLETDAPFLAPLPCRGKKNHPALLVHTAAHVAGLRGCTVEELARQTTANARRLFRC